MAGRKYYVYPILSITFSNDKTKGLFTPSKIESIK